MKRFVLALALTSLAGPAMAQGAACAPRDVVVKRLAEAYGETRRAMGLGGQGAVVEVFASDSSGSWTITVTGPDGITCLIAAGQAFESMAKRFRFQATTPEARQPSRGDSPSIISFTPVTVSST